MGGVALFDRHGAKRRQENRSFCLASFGAVAA